VSLDKELSARLDGIARVLEDYLGRDPGALARDIETPARLYRIELALTDLVAFLTSGFSPSGNTIAFSIQDPENAKVHAGRSTKSLGAWLNDTGRTFTISKVTAISDADDYTFALYKSASKTDLSTANDTLLVTVPCSSNGTSVFSAELTTLAVNTIEPNKWLIWEHISGSAESITVQLAGTLA